MKTMNQHSEEFVADLIERVAAYCEKHGIAKSTFGRLAANDGKFMSRIEGAYGRRNERGLSVTLNQIQCAERQLADPAPGARKREAAE